MPHTLRRPPRLAAAGLHEHSFARVASVRDLEERLTQLRLTAACVQLNREQISELVGIAAELIEERKRIRRLLERLPENFAEVRKILNELSRVVR